ncbi:MAG: hypothetical protein EOP83_14035 [Verrucomicrobiaceae bacterium]|nr:MAG: hypothetical protein EOP83_14035 [Verrucomicrobiaceae bacterium]
MNKLQSVINVGTAAGNLGTAAKLRALAFVGALLAAPAAMAQGETNAGVDAVVDAIEGLGPQMGLVVVACVGLALIGFGALAAIGLMKRIGGK